MEKGRGKKEKVSGDRAKAAKILARAMRDYVIRKKKRIEEK